MNDKRKNSSDLLFDDSEIPFIDSDDEVIGELTQEFLEVEDCMVDPSTQEFLEVDDNIFGESSQAFVEASPVFHRLPLYYHIGSGFENRPSTSSVGSVYVENAPRVNMEEAIIIEEIARKRNRKYQAEEISFRTRVDVSRIPAIVQNQPLTAAVNVVKDLFQHLIRRTSEGLKPVDLIRFCVRADGLDKPISTKLLLVSNLTVENVLATVMKVLQSKDEIALDAGFIVDVITIRKDEGAGRIQRVVNIDVDRLGKKSIISVPEDDMGLCAAKAIIFALAHLAKDRKVINVLGDRRRKTLFNNAVNLHKEAGVPLGPCTYAELAQFERHLKVQIVVFSAEIFNKMSYKGDKRPKRINLWLHNNHYDIIKSLTGFNASNFYCEGCEKPYQNIEDHKCDFNCHICRRLNCVKGEKLKCDDCDRECESADCYAAHKQLTGAQKFSLCDKLYQCGLCSQVIFRRKCPKGLHRCGTVVCTSCKLYVEMEKHFCFLKVVPPKKSSDKLLFFDFETDQSTGEHLVNFAVAQYSDGAEAVFKGYSACQEFCAWLFSPRHKGFTVVAHNMKGFDGQFIVAWLLAQGTAPEVIPNGSMLMCIRHKALNIRIIDSLNFLPMSLSKLPSCFGLTEMKKGYFPHLFNSPENQNYVGSLPAMQFFSPDSMSTSARAVFISWYEERKQKEFDFGAEMLEYCRSDVDILRRCCLEFRTQFIEVTKIDPLQYVTIASACMAVYRSMHIQSETIAMVPLHGYVNETNYSPDGVRWLDFVSFTEGVDIQHALNRTGECKIGGVSVDGFCKENKTIYQFHGCFYHGCEVCFDSDARHPLKGVTMSAVKKKTEQTTKKLQDLGFSVVEMWEHEFQQKKKNDPTLQNFLGNHHLQDRLNPRDAFFGGRTNAIKLYHEGPSKYVDFTSLYPWVNKYCRYPVGHPEIVTENFSDIQSYFGIMKCRTVPPKKLYFPVLPYRCHGKLMFPLCKTCVETKQQSPCDHTDDERALIGTWVTEEIKLAKEKGYQVTHIYEVYQFHKTSTSLFSSYIDLFLKIKQESSGWPNECHTEEKKAEYIRQYFDKEGVMLDVECINKNPGRRQVAKLALNSFWGRWGMNLNKDKLNFVNSLPDFNKFLNDTTKNIKDVYFPSQEIAAMQWEKMKEFVGQDSETNIFLAAFTTAWARIKLYSSMDELGRAVLYHDTDSIIYASTGENDPPLGNFLGEFTDELDGDTIMTFVSGGAKNYAYQTENGQTCCKVRGFTLNFRNAQMLNFDAMKSLICSMDCDSTITLKNPSKIVREAKRRKVLNKEEKKLYKIVYDKRVLKDDFSTLPYGY